jgi:hypothetical protein
MSTYIQRDVSTTREGLTRVPVTTTNVPAPAQQPNVKKKPGLSYFVVENGVVVSKSR